MAAYLKLVLSESDVSIAKNTSKVTAKLYYYGNGASYNYNNPSGTIKIDGTSYSFDHDFTTSTSAQLLATKSKTVTHGSDGSKTVSVSASFKTGVSLGTMSTSATLKLTKIARTSTLSLNKTSVPADESTTVTATATKQSSSLTDTLTVTLGGYSKTIYSGTAFTIPKSWVNGISGTSATATVKVTTKSGSTTIGSATKSLTVTVPTTTEFYPSISNISVSEANATVTSAFPNLGGLYVKSLSKLNVGITAVKAYSSAISTYSTTFDGATYKTASFTTNAINATGDLAISAKVTDGRSRSGTSTKTIQVVDYFTPTVTVKCTQRKNDDGTSKNTVTVKYNVAPVKNANNEAQNTKTLVLYYKASNDENYSEMPLTMADWNGSLDVDFNNIDSTVTYEYKAVLTDSINTNNPATSTAITGVITLSRLAGGKGVTLFEEATEEGFKVGGGKPSKFTGNANIDGNIYLLNGSYVAGKTTDGTILGNFTPVNLSNNCVIGWGGYDTAKGSTYLYGNSLNLYSKNGVTYNGKSASMIKFQTAHVSVTVNANSYKDVAITFPQAFSAVPRVVVCIASSSTAGAIGSITAAVLGGSEKTTGFTARVYNAGAAQRAPVLIWTATGVL